MIVEGNIIKCCTIRMKHENETAILIIITIAANASDFLAPKILI